MMINAVETGFMATLQDAAQAIGGRAEQGAVAYASVGSDSRKIQPGQLFVALRGEKFDGHAFVEECLRNGAAAAMVDERGASTLPAGLPLLVVDDTRLAMGRLAAAWRRQLNMPLAAITGSNGKTTVKEMLANILRTQAGQDHVLATEGNLNNDIGLPLTLLKLRAHHQFAVAEMGMNHPGEIDYLTHIADPNVALVNNAQAAHLAGLGSVEAVARAKGEIFAGLADAGIAVINADDAFAPLWRELASPHTILSFGLDQPADVSASWQLDQFGSDIQIKTPQGETRFHLPVAGLHNVRNALAATSVALAMGIGLATVQAGLESFGGVKGRLQRKSGKGGALVIDDTYNANPASMSAAIEVLAVQPGQKIFVMGDMGELGPEAAEHHTRIGEKARAAGIPQLFALGELSQHAVKAFGAGAQHFDSPEALVKTLEPSLKPDTTVLVKGSRFMHMERVVEMITTTQEKGAH
jgi:UDP-N-acetylmuramoyl-tripeptide--D-alanyl-D-alanine ligase